jgi:hypothetical protein
LIVTGLLGLEVPFEFILTFAADRYCNWFFAYLMAVLEGRHQMEGRHQIKHHFLLL